MKVKCNGHYGELVSMETQYGIIKKDGSVKNFYSISMRIDSYTTINLENVLEDDIFVENKRES